MQVDIAVDAETIQSGALQLSYLGTGSNELPAFSVSLDSLLTLQQGIVYNLQLRTYYNGSGTI